MARSAPLLAAVLFALPAAAQPPTPLDLARGLRENGLADLALEYLDEQAAKNPSAEFQSVLPLERAIALLATADDETDAAARDGLTAQARDELERFLRANPKHPRGPEAAVALARATALTAKSALYRAGKIADDAQYKATAAAARPLFRDAAKAFGLAAAQFDEQARQPGLTADRKQQIAREVAQAELDRAVTQYQISRTYVAPTADELVDRAKAISDARKQFDAIADRYAGTPVGSVARAWSGQCDIATDSRVAGERTFEEVKRDASPQAAAGRRMVRFFEVRMKFEDAVTKGRPQDVQAARTAAADWLRAYGAGRLTAESAAVRYQLAVLKLREAEGQIREDPRTKQPVVSPAAMAALRDAERDFRKLTETDNEYTDRAADQRNKAVRLMVGDADIDPVKVATFDEAVMAAAVQFDKALKEPAAGRDGRLTKAVALLERAVAMPVPRDGQRELTDAQLRLAFAYLVADRPHQAAVLGEHLARTAKPAGMAARGGAYAVRAYLIAAGKLPPDDAAGRKADTDRAAAVAQFLDAAYPADPSTDDTRIALGQLLVKDGKPREAFDVLARVNPSHPKAAVARLMAGSATFDLLRAAPDRAELSRRLIAAIGAVPKPTADAPAGDAEAFARMNLLLAQVHLTDVPAGFPQAERTAAGTRAVLKDLPQISEPERQTLAFQTEETRLRAIYGQIVPQLSGPKASEALARLDAVLADTVKAGPAAKPDQEPTAAAAARRLDDFRRNEIIALALKARVREKSVDKAGQLFDLLKAFGGSADAGVQALAQLVAGVRPEIDALRRDGKTAEAADLVAGVGNLLDKVIGDPNLTPGQKVYLGRALKEIGSYDKAADVLKSVPAPPSDQLAANPNDLQGDARSAVLLYRVAQLELAETYRLAKNYPAADAVLKPATDEPGWAKNAPNFRKEALYLIEAKAADAATVQDAQPLWAEALAGWNKFAGEYRALLVRPLPPIPPEPKALPANASDAARKKFDAEMKARVDAEAKQGDARRQKESVLKPLYFDAFFEVQRCIVAGNTRLLNDNPDKLARSLDKVADTIKKVEDANPDLKDETKAKFADLLRAHPDLRARYEAKGGKAFAMPPGEPAAVLPK